MVGKSAHGALLFRQSFRSRRRSASKLEEESLSSKAEALLEENDYLVPCGSECSGSSLISLELGRQNHMRCGCWDPNSNLLPTQSFVATSALSLGTKQDVGQAT